MKINKQIQQYIWEMYDADQGSRRLVAGRSKKPENYLVYAVDAANNQRIHRLIETFRYPTEKTVGQESLEKFWLVIQHQDFDLSL